MLLARLIPAHAGKTSCFFSSRSALSAHPRSRGENGRRSGPRRRRRGSSPLTRGKQPVGPRGPGVRGLIPAHAGKTDSHRRTGRWYRAHPRSRGENISPESSSTPKKGSSPLTRGKHRQRGWLLDRNRLIPAHAGKTQRGVEVFQRAAAHPRSRGENRVCGVPDSHPGGSSPLTRGKQSETPVRCARTGLIPAHAGKTRCPSRARKRRAAHPRSRGENCRLPDARSLVEGSSPLTRGKHRGPEGHVRGGRLIPAHAGKTLRLSSPTSANGAHPRSRGENRGVTYHAVHSSGSSPLTRGKLSRSSSSRCRRRLIPAHAGKTSSLNPPRPRQRAHPRSRGENTWTNARPYHCAGSSPLTRGKRRQLRRARRARRLIPAHAGKTPRDRRVDSPAEAHPRSRGENEPITVATAPRRGSSPLTRGKLSRRQECTRMTRLIPAHAGKTSAFDAARSARAAHPRSRGENPRRIRRQYAHGGSSPLTRGKRELRRLPADHRGLIPAHAGKTSRTPRRATSCAAHPRSRGENARSVFWLVRCAGSSPLTRGKLAARWADRSSRRLIPAHAGKTRRTPTGIRRRTAHPRSRGENRFVIDGQTKRFGSSPLTRGKPVLTAGLTRCIGLIPAHAGKTRRIIRPPLARLAHPRSRGENAVLHICVFVGRGSSPLTRGKPTYNLPNYVGERLIPAHAGKTRSTTSATTESAAHPRSRGENRCRLHSCHAPIGSSPLTRGKLLRSRVGAGRYGLIPAHAGKTLVGERERFGGEAHPRSRGENMTGRCEEETRLGSSPLTRGKRAGGDAALHEVRLIPAHAGKTRGLPHTPASHPAHPRSRGENL